MTLDSASESGPPPGERRIIKRYSNRKLYDTQASTYVTLLQVAEMIRGGEEVQIIDNATKEDKTDVTLALILSEELRTRPRTVPLATLKALVRHGGERLLSQLRGGPIGKFMPKEGGEEGLGAEPEELAEDEMSQTKDGRAGLRATLAEWQNTIDERIRAVLPNFSAFRELTQEVERLRARLDTLEEKMGGKPPDQGNKPSD